MNTIDEPIEPEDFDYSDDDGFYDDCPKCGRTYDHIDADYQICSKCGWNVEEQKFGERREPEEEDYLNGDADILTGQWI